MQAKFDEKADIQSFLKSIILDDNGSIEGLEIKMVKVKNDKFLVVPQCNGLEQLLREYAKPDGARLAIWLLAFVQPPGNKSL